MRTIIFILVVFESNCLYAQDIWFKPSGNCYSDTLLAFADELPKWQIDSITIADYLNKKIVKRKVDLRNANGKVIIQVLIHKDGKPCCYGILERTNINIFPYEHLSDFVNEMPYWIPGKQSRVIGDVICKVELELKEGSFTEVIYILKQNLINLR